MTMTMWRFRNRLGNSLACKGEHVWDDIVSQMGDQVMASAERNLFQHRWLENRAVGHGQP
jgi:hypothetical protein